MKHTVRGHLGHSPGYATPISLWSPKHFITPKGELAPTKQSLSVLSSTPQPLGAPNLLSVSADLPDVDILYR